MSEWMTEREAIRPVLLTLKIADCSAGVYVCCSSVSAVRYRSTHTTTQHTQQWQYDLDSTFGKQPLTSACYPVQE